MRDSYHLPPRQPVSWRMIRQPVGVHLDRPYTAVEAPRRPGSSAASGGEWAGGKRRHRHQHRGGRPQTQQQQWGIEASAEARRRLASAPAASPTRVTAAAPKPWFPTSDPAPLDKRQGPPTPFEPPPLLKAPLRKHQLEGRPWTAATLAEWPPVVPWGPLHAPSPGAPPGSAGATGGGGWVRERRRQEQRVAVGASSAPPAVSSSGGGPASDGLHQWVSSPPPPPRPGWDGHLPHKERRRPVSPPPLALQGGVSGGGSGFLDRVRREVAAEALQSRRPGAAPLWAPKNRRVG